MGPVLVILLVTSTSAKSNTTDMLNVFMENVSLTAMTSNVKTNAVIMVNVFLVNASLTATN